VKIQLLYSSVLVEIKPTVGDDYPTVLRKMLSIKRDSYGGWITDPKILFLEHYTGTGVTLEQFIQFFKLSGIDVVFRHEIA
jgi:hypothetical protein